MSTLFDQQFEDDLCDLLHSIVGYTVFYATNGKLNGFFFSSTGCVSNDVKDCVVFKNMVTSTRLGRRTVACLPIYGSIKEHGWAAFSPFLSADALPEELNGIPELLAQRAERGDL